MEYSIEARKGVRVTCNRWSNPTRLAFQGSFPGVSHQPVVFAVSMRFLSLFRYLQQTNIHYFCFPLTMLHFMVIIVVAVVVIYVFIYLFPLFRPAAGLRSPPAARSCRLPPDPRPSVRPST